MLSFDDPKPTQEEVDRIMAAYPKDLFEERVLQIVRRHGFDRETAEEIIRNVITEKENRNG